MAQAALEGGAALFAHGRHAGSLRGRGVGDLAGGHLPGRAALDSGSCLAPVPGGRLPVGRRCAGGALSEGRRAHRPPAAQVASQRRHSGRAAIYDLLRGPLRPGHGPGRLSQALGSVAGAGTHHLGLRHPALSPDGRGSHFPAGLRLHAGHPLRAGHFLRPGILPGQV